MQRYETNHRKKVVEETVQPVFLGAAVNYQKMICSEWVSSLRILQADTPTRLS
jgi:hypothetical protein